MSPAFNPSSAIQPIGVYDSGVGGISVLKSLREQLATEHFLYVGDSAYSPYGEKQTGFLLQRAHEIADFMLQQQVKALVLACNTISVVAAQALRARYAFPIIAMEPAIKPAALASKSKVVLVLATHNTLASASVARLCEQYGGNVRMILQPCPGLVEQIEQGAFDHPSTLALLRRYLQPGLAAGADTIVLGCTHYPLLSQQIKQLAGPGVTLLEPSAAIARQLSKVLTQQSGQANAPHQQPTNPSALGTTCFYSSGSVAALQDLLIKTGEEEVQVQPLPPLTTTPRLALPEETQQR